MTDKTQPLAAPPGTKWVVSKSSGTDRHQSEDRYQIGLFPEGAEVDVWGSYLKEFGPAPHFPNGGSFPGYALARETFASGSQIRGASRRVLRTYARQRSEHDLFARLRKAFS